MDRCPWSKCEKPWSEHRGLERVVHPENGEREQIAAGARTNGGVLCDTRSGPCNCGAWH